MRKYSLWIGLAALALAGSTSANATSIYDQGFETDTSGWFDNSTDPGFGSISRAASGTGGVTAYQGGFFAFVNDSTPNGATAGNSTAPFTRFGGYSATFPGTYAASTAIYLNTGWASGSGFDYSVASNNSSGNHLRDFIFHVSNIGGNLLVNASNNSSNALPDGSLTSPPSYQVTSSGWYIFQQVFRNDGGQLAVDMNLYDASMALLFTKTLSQASDTIPGVVGGNRYGWFTLVNVSDANGLAIDSVNLSTVPVPAALPLFASGLGLMGFVARRRRRKQIAAA